MAAIVEYESSWKPWSIDDDTAHHSYHFSTRQDAQREEMALLSIGHNLDIGLAQVNSSNFAEYGLQPMTAFDPCSNLRAGSAIIRNDYATAYHTNWIGRRIITSADLYQQQQHALIHAFSAYNSGREWASMDYAHHVYTLGLNVTGFNEVAFRSSLPLIRIYHPIKDQQ